MHNVEAIKTTYSRLKEWAAAQGITVTEAPLEMETPAKFDGPSIVLHRGYDLPTRCFYLLHSLGSVVAWSVAPNDAQQVYDELRAAKAAKAKQPARLERALKGFYAFEDVVSQYAVWLLDEIGHADLIRAYTEFARADMEAMLQFHRSGIAPQWSAFFADWQAKIARGEQPLHPFEPKPIPSFQPVPIQPQEVVQEVDGVP